MAERKPAQTGDVKGMEGTKIKWDDSNMQSSYANVCNVTSTREEVVMLFGINQAWNRGQKEVTIQLTDRIIIIPTPLSAWRPCSKAWSRNTRSDSVS